MSKEMRCPNCLERVQVKGDGSAVCAACGGTFRFEEGQAKLAGVSEFDTLKKTVALQSCLLYTSPSPRDGLLSRMPSSA